VISELRAALPDGALLTDPAGLFVYESDGFTIAKARPRAVAFPGTLDEVIRVVKVLARHGVQIVPRGSGTGLAGGCVAFEQGVIVSTTRMNRILKIDLDNRVAHVEAGVRNTQLSDAAALLTGGAGYHFAPDPSSQRASTIGGNAATNAGGIHTLKDFVSSNHVLGLQMVLADGSVLETGAQNGCYESSGFDLTGLICGSEGTFGIITSLWVRLAPKATSFRTIVGFFSDTAHACDTVSDVIGAGLLPAAMEMMDGRMVKVVEEANHFGFPPNAQSLVLVEIDGIDALLDGQMNQVADICRRHNAITVETSGDPVVGGQQW
jgi:glycolate oxidase